MKYEELPAVSGAADVSRRLYLPLFEWIAFRLRPGKTLIVGINGPQGAGKSTLCRALAKMFERQGTIAAAISIDDFYLTRAEQIHLASAHPSNLYLQNRGYPGTHDVGLALKTMRAFQDRIEVVIPRYDKSAYQGKGDRAPVSEWTRVKSPADVVLFEGWMLGFQPVGVSNDAAFMEIDEKLQAYMSLWETLDLFVFLDPLDHRYVVDWRIEAEEKMKAEGKSGMSAVEVERYVRLFLKAYEIYLPKLREDGPGIRSALRVRIAQDRAPPY